MTDTQDLIAQLRKDAHHHIDGQMAGLMGEAADKLEAAQAEIERLTSLFNNSTASHEETMGRAMNAEAERDAAAGASPVQPSQAGLNELTKVYASIYASPHHITFTTQGLQQLIAAINAKGAAS